MKNSEIGVNVSKTEFVDYLNSVRGGQFFIVKGYENAQSERADHILRFGIKYENIKNKDIKTVRNALACNAYMNVIIRHGVWVPENSLNLEAMTKNGINCSINCTASFETLLNGVTAKAELKGCFNLSDSTIFTNRKANGRVPVTLSYNLSSTHPMFTTALETLLNSLVAPRPASVEYEKAGKSCYSLEKEDDITQWYIRDVLEIQKTVLVAGSYEFKATGVPVAIKEAIARQYLLTSKYRQFILTAGKFDSITIEGQAILMDTESGDENFFLALPEHVKANAIVQAEAV
jgi:hypothetical protein